MDVAGHSRLSPSYAGWYGDSADRQGGRDFCVSVFEVNDGMIAAERDYFDNAAVMSQLGLMPGA